MGGGADVSEWTRARARLAVATRFGAPKKEIETLKREVKTARLAEVIEKTLADWPPLTPEQRTRLADLLRPTA